MKKIYNSITEMVGHTPLLRLNRLCRKHKVKAEILGKCEAYNPLFSVKDRIALKMLEKRKRAERSTVKRFLWKPLREIRALLCRRCVRPRDINW